jgi:hypothetical protein
LTLTDYQRKLNERRAMAQLKEEAVFGLLGGLILLVWGFVGYLDNSGFLEKVFIGIMLAGGLLFLLGLIFPSLLYYPKQGFFVLGNYIGRIIFSVLLGIIYIIFVLPIGAIMARKRQDYLLIQWDERFEAAGVDSALSSWQDIACGTGSPTRLKGFMYSIFRLFAYFTVRRHFILLPLLCILLLLGLLFFFISSTVIAPFIYTLF